MKIFIHCCVVYILFSCFVLFSFYSPFSRFALRFDNEKFEFRNTERQDVVFMLISIDSLNPGRILDFANLNDISGVAAPGETVEMDLPGDAFFQFNILLKKQNQPLAVRQINSYDFSEILHTQNQLNNHAEVVRTLKIKLIKFLVFTLITVILFLFLLVYRKSLGFENRITDWFLLVISFFICLGNIAHFSLSAEYICYALIYI